MDIETRDIAIRDLRPNNGEVDGLPKNPRKISKKNLEKLKKSVQDAPEMLRLRELICVEHPDGSAVAALTLDLQQRRTKERYDKLCGLDPTKRYTRNDYIKAGAQAIQGYMLRYIYFLDPKWRKRLTVSEIPFSKIDEMGAGMYKGENVTRAERHAITTEQRKEEQNAK